MPEYSKPSLSDSALENAGRTRLGGIKKSTRIGIGAVVAAISTFWVLGEYITLREAAEYSRDSIPDPWTIDEEFPHDVFSFARLYHSGSWDTDYVGADGWLSYRLQELSSMQVDPNPPVLEITDAELVNYPFAFMANPATYDEVFDLSDAEAESLNSYLGNGGFILVDDFWGKDMWDNFVEQMEKVFPDIAPEELPPDHPIFNGVFEMDVIPQVPSHDAAEKHLENGDDHLHYEIAMLRHGESERDLITPRFMAWRDKKGRIMMIACHNNDLADGWEEEGFAPWFFEKYSEKYCYPMAINILYYTLTH